MERAPYGNSLHFRSRRKDTSTSAERMAQPVQRSKPALGAGCIVAQADHFLDALAKKAHRSSCAMTERSLQVHLDS
jgi:hypothetical protein